MARPRKVSDEDVFAAVYRAMNRLAPWEFTLAEIAAEAGVTAGALVQRFGSKRDLLLQLMEAWSGGTRDMLARIRAQSASPLGAVRAWAEGFARMGESPGGMAHQLAWLQQDMADPDFRRHVERQGKETTAVLTEWLRDAITSGELRRSADAPALARGIQAMASGSLISWGFMRQGTARRWVLRDVDLLLEPFSGLKDSSP